MEVPFIFEWYLLSCSFYFIHCGLDVKSQCSTIQFAAWQSTTGICRRPPYRTVYAYNNICYIIVNNNKRFFAYFLLCVLHKVTQIFKRMAIVKNQIPKSLEFISPRLLIECAGTAKKLRLRFGCNAEVQPSVVLQTTEASLMILLHYAELIRITQAFRDSFTA